MITVVGLDGREPPPAARAAIDAAELVAGAKRHLDALAVPAPRRLEMGPVEPVLNQLFAAVDAGRPVAIAASGDPGFFGILRLLGAHNRPATVFAATSSVAQAFAALGRSWDDAVVTSAHGRDLARAVNVCRAQPKVAVLTAPGRGPAELGAALIGTNRVLYIAIDLGRPTQRVLQCTPTEASERTWPALNMVLSLDPTWVSADAGWVAGHEGAPPGWALAEDEFAHRDSMITKPEVRALVLARLGPRLGTSVWDIGAGSGSVAIECARFGAAVIAVEQDPAACAMIAANAARHRVTLEIVSGRAPQVLPPLAPADAIFVGGGGVEVLRSALALARPQRAVMTLAAVDRVADVRAALLANGLDVDGVQLQASRLASLPPDSVRLLAANPVFVLWGRRP